MLLGLFFAVLLPIYAYCFGYVDTRNMTTIREVQEDHKTYIVVRQYDDRLILARLSGMHVEPEYRIHYLNNGGTVSFKLVRLQWGTLDFSHVDSFSKDAAQGMFF